MCRPPFRGYDHGLEEPDNAPEQADPHFDRSGAKITREGGDAIIDHADAKVASARVVMGPGIASISDADIVEMYNEILDAQWGLLQQWNKTVVEEPPGEKQIDYYEDSDQWVPRGDVLRCIIDDAGPNGEVTIHIGDQELSLSRGRYRRPRN